MRWRKKRWRSCDHQQKSLYTNWQLEVWGTFQGQTEISWTRNLPFLLFVTERKAIISCLLVWHNLLLISAYTTLKRLLGIKPTSNYIITLWLLASTWASSQHFKFTPLPACVSTDTLQIRWALMLWCTDVLCHIDAMNYSHCSVTGFRGLAALNLASLRTTSSRTAGFMYHSTSNKSKTKV